MTDYDTILAARSRWAVALGALPRERVLALGADLAARFEVTPAAVPQSGLTLLTLRDSVEKQAFYLGEIPLSTCHVFLRDGATTVEGGAMFMADDVDLVSAMAICDGVLANRLGGWETVADGVRDGLDRLDEEARLRNTMLKRSRVNFALLNQEDDETGEKEDGQ
ncbi:MAG: phosphonate C-P lyase system protein PhnG [Capsulimonadales bacterium]|nr:phosphonate C-P lyase system protein PhnG [Capsulimonadales bacterium]